MIDLARPIDGALLILDGGCTIDREHAVNEMMVNENPGEAIQELVASLHASREQLLLNVSQFTGTQHRMFSELISRVVYTSLRMGEIEDAESAWRQARTTGDPEHLRWAAESAARASMMLRNANLFMVNVLNTVADCGIDFTHALSAVETHLRLLSTKHAEFEPAPGWPEPGSIDVLTKLAHEVIEKEIGPAADTAQVQLQYQINYLDSYSSAAYPTAGEAVYLLNEIIREAERPGLREQIDLRLGGILHLPMNWETRPRPAMVTTALSEVDWKPTAADCIQEPNSR